MKHVKIDNLLSFGEEGYNTIRWGFRDLGVDVVQAVREPGSGMKSRLVGSEFVFLAGPSVAEELLALPNDHQLFLFFEPEFRVTMLENNVIGELHGHQVIECRNLPPRLLVGAWVCDRNVIGHIASWIRSPQERLNLPSYQCHKIVQGAKIVQMEESGREDGPVTLLLDNEQVHNVSRHWYNTHAPVTGGYFVVYDNGHTSFSPEEPFEKGYTRI